MQMTHYTGQKYDLARITNKRIFFTDEVHERFGTTLRRLLRRLPSLSSFSEGSQDAIKLYFTHKPRKKFLIWFLLFYGCYKLYSWHVDPGRTEVLNQRWYYPFILESRDPVSSTSSILNLQSHPAGQNGETIKAAWKTGAWSVEVAQPEVQIQRPYTPLPPLEDSAPLECMRLFVRREPEGIVSTFLHNEPPGTLILMRGPFVEFAVPDDVGEIVFLAGGTGITPALQIAHCMFKARGLKEEDLPHMRILWANRRREDNLTGLETDEVRQFRHSLWGRIRGAITSAEGVKQKDVQLEQPNELPVVKQARLVDEIEEMAAKSAGKLSIEYFVDDEGTFITDRVLQSRFKNTQSTATPDGKGGRKKLILVAGPDGFVDYYAGSKIWVGDKLRPGPLGGILKRIKPSDWDVWTL